MTNYKRFFAIILSAIMLLSLIPFSVLADESDAWDGTPGTAFASGKGTEADPYVIKTAAELAYFAKTVNEGKAYTDEYIVLGANINLDNVDWTPIGDNTELVPATGDEAGVYAEFSGNFDGKGFTISGLYAETPENDYVGLFGFVTFATIKNVVIKDACLYGYENVGAVAGYAGASVIEGCKTVDGEIYAENKEAGGIVGDVTNSEIKNCHNCADVYVYSENVGGIVGEASDSLITDCSNVGNICGENGVGGIVGYTYNNYISPDDESAATQAAVANCYNGGNISGEYGYIGGIVGGGEFIGVADCQNLGAVEGEYGVGGIVGVLGSGTVNSSVNIGTVTADFDNGGIVGALLNYTSEDDSILAFLGMVNDCYYFDKSCEIGVAYFDGQSAEEELSGVTAVSEEDLKNAEVYSGLDLKGAWTMGRFFPELVAHKDAYRLMVKQPEEEDKTVNPDDIVLDGYVKVLGVELKDGEYLANGATEPTTVTPDVGYAYFKNGKLYLNNFNYVGEGALYGVAKYVIVTYGNVEIVLVGNNVINLQDSDYSAKFAVAHARNSDSDELSVIYSGEGTLNLTSASVAIQCAGQLIIENGNYNITAYESAIRAEDIYIIDGKFDVYSDYDDAFSADYIYIEDGEFDVETYDSDAFYAEYELIIKNGDFYIDAEYESFESYEYLYIENGNFELYSYCGTAAIYSEYDLYIQGGEFEINTDDDGISSYGGIYINGGKFDIECSSDGIYAEYDIEIKNAKIDVYAGDCGIETYDGNITVDNSSLNIDAGYGLSCDYEDLYVSNSKLNLNCYYGIKTYGECVLTDTKADIYCEYGIYASDYFELNGGELDIEAYEGIDAYDVVFAGGKSNITANGVGIECGTVCFEDGTHTIKANNMAVDYSESYSYFEDKVTETWVYDGDWAEELYIAPLNAASPDELPTDDDTQGGETDETDYGVIYVGGVKMSDGDYLANGASTVSQKAPVRGGYAYYKDGVLYLNNFDYDGAGYKLYTNASYYINTLIYAENNLVIKLEGENIISATDYIADGITVVGDLAINGEGALEIIATEGIYSYGADNSIAIYAEVTINAENVGITASVVDVFGGKLVVKGETAIKASVNLYNDFQIVEGSLDGKNVVIQYVEPAKKPEPTPEPQPIGLRGDVNKSGAIDMMDYILIKRAYFGTFTLDETAQRLADVNDSNSVDMMDYILIKRMYFGTFELSQDLKYVY